MKLVRRAGGSHSLVPKKGDGGLRDPDQAQDAMVIRCSRRLLFAAVSVVMFAAVAPAVARASTDLGPIGFGAVVVDDARSHVLVSGPSGNVVEILDFSGNVVGTIPNLYGRNQIFRAAQGVMV